MGAWNIVQGTVFFCLVFQGNVYRNVLHGLRPCPVGVVLMPQLEGERQDHGRALSVSNVQGHGSEHCWDHHSGCYGIHTSCPFLDELFLP